MTQSCSASQVLFLSYRLHLTALQKVIAKGGYHIVDMVSKVSVLVHVQYGACIQV